MIVQVVLLASLAIVVLYAFGQRRRSGPISYSIMLTAAAGALLVAFPEVSTRVANSIGVGRGADLVFYVFMLIMFAAVANLHLRMRASAEITTQLARELALVSARRPDEGQSR